MSFPADGSRPIHTWTPQQRRVVVSQCSPLGSWKDLRTRSFPKTLTSRLAQRSSAASAVDGSKICAAADQ